MKSSFNNHYPFRSFKKKRSFLLGTALALLFFLSLDKRGFSLCKISSNLPFSSHWATSAPTEKDKEILKQLAAKPFQYLGSGAQCYAFVSHDGDYVLKFFKMKHLLPKNWLRHFSFPVLANYRLRKIDQRIFRQRELFTNYKRAYEDLREETGLFLIHLNKTKELSLTATLLDKGGKKHRVHLDDFEFVVQQKATLIPEHISQLINQGNLEKAKQALFALIEQIRLQYTRGFIDRDSGINHNYGFVGDRVIHFDIGRLTYNEETKSSFLEQQEILRVIKKLETYLEKSHPELLPALQNLQRDLL